MVKIFVLSVFLGMSTSRVLTWGHRAKNAIFKKPLFERRRSGQPEQLNIARVRDDRARIFRQIILLRLYLSSLCLKTFVLSQNICCDNCLWNVSNQIMFPFYLSNKLDTDFCLKNNSIRKVSNLFCQMQFSSELSVISQWCYYRPAELQTCKSSVQFRLKYRQRRQA